MGLRFVLQFFARRLCLSEVSDSAFSAFYDDPDARPRIGARVQ